MIIKRLKQEVIEDTYSRTNNNKWAEKAVKSDLDLMNLLNQAEDNIRQWLYTTSYKSLDMIKEQLVWDDADIFRVVMDMFIITLMDDTPKTIQQVVSVGASSLEKNLQDSFDSIKAASEMLGIMCELDIVDVIPAHDGDTEYTMISSEYSLPDDVMERIYNTKYMPPMLIKPKHIRRNTDFAHLTYKESVILGDKHNQHDDELALDVINIQNSIPLELDDYILSLPEQSNKPLDTPVKIVNFERMKNASNTVYQVIKESDNLFYNTHAYDMRGRLYSNGYYVHIQSTEYKKCLINFAYKEIIKDTL